MQTPKGGLIDVFWPCSGLLIEQKSASIDLDRPESRQGWDVTPQQQAFRYVYDLDNKPSVNYVCICNFKEFRLYNKRCIAEGKGKPFKVFTLKNLRSNLGILREITKKQNQINEKQLDYCTRVNANVDNYSFQKLDTQEILRIAQVRATCMKKCDKGNWVWLYRDRKQIYKDCIETRLALYAAWEKLAEGSLTLDELKGYSAALIDLVEWNTLISPLVGMPKLDKKRYWPSYKKINPADLDEIQYNLSKVVMLHIPGDYPEGSSVVSIDIYDESYKCFSFKKGYLTKREPEYDEDNHYVGEKFYSRVLHDKKIFSENVSLQNKILNILSESSVVVCDAPSYVNAWLMLHFKNYWTSYSNKTINFISIVDYFTDCENDALLSQRFKSSGLSFGDEFNNFAFAVSYIKKRKWDSEIVKKHSNMHLSF